MGHPIQLTDETFEEEALKASEPVLVDFWAEWCGPCRMIAPIIEELAEEYSGRAKVCKVDVDACERTASEYGIRSIPMLLIFKDGKVLDQIVGMTQKKRIAEKLDAVL